MTGFEFFSPGFSQPLLAKRLARQREEEGWTGITFTDSQCLSGDPYVAMALAAETTKTLKLGTGVTNPLTRHPSVTASSAATVAIESGGRVELGIGRGDSSLAHLGLAPAPVEVLAEYVAMLRHYLRGEEVALDQAAGAAAHRLGDALPLKESPGGSTLRWVRHVDGYQPVPVGVVASGPKVLRLAGAGADRVLLAVGADPERVSWAIEQARSGAGPAQALRFGAYVNVVVDDDVDRGVRLAAGAISSFARFSVMHGKTSGPLSEETKRSMERIPGQYEMRRHFTSANPAAAEAAALAPSFAIVGPASYCKERLLQLGELGVDRFYVSGPTRDADPEGAGVAHRRFCQEILPGLGQ